MAHRSSYLRGSCFKMSRRYRINPFCGAGTLQDAARRQSHYFGSTKSSADWCEMDQAWNADRGHVYGSARSSDTILKVSRATAAFRVSITPRRVERHAPNYVTVVPGRLFRPLDVSRSVIVVDISPIVFSYAALFTNPVVEIAPLQAKIESFVSRCKSASREKQI